ncbi:MAG: hypothetical protein MUQ10_06270 [Anaerolineae bacterium]|nr:hypothetical protein [Anaerolineae bacterium]
MGYELLGHMTASAMSDVAAVLQVSGKQVSTVAMVPAEERIPMIVVRSRDRLDLGKYASVGSEQMKARE